MPKEKERLDILLAKKGFFSSRQRAKAEIMAGLVLVNGEKIEKAGTRVETGAAIRILGQEHPYVSRGGLKLEKALKTFAIVLDGKTVMDVGASTGGFTDCALQHGAKKVYAIDVGWSQLAWRLRQDPRVIVLERTNIRYLQPETIPELVHFACIDVSFISLEKVLPKVGEFLIPQGEVIALVKPQFEAGPERVGKKGVVQDPAVQEEVLTRITQAARRMGFGIAGLTFSPISGAQGNKEYLLYLLKGKQEEDMPLEEMIRKTVSAAWQEVH